MLVITAALVLTGCAGQMGQNLAPPPQQTAADTLAITITSPASGSTMSSPVAVSATASGTTAITDMQVLVDSTLAAESHSGSIQATIQASAGTHQLTVTAKDSTGANGQKSLAFTVQSESAASVTITWPPDQSTMPSPVHVAAMSTDTNPELNLSLSVDGQPVTSFGGQSLQADVPLEIGPHTVTITSNDADQKQAQQTVHITVPAPSYVAVVNDDSTITSFLVDYTIGNLRPFAYIAVPGAQRLTSAIEPFFGIAVQTGDGRLATYPDESELGTFDNAWPVPENSFLPPFVGSAVSSTVREMVSHSSDYLYQSAAGAKYIRGFTQAGELPGSPFTAAGGSSNPVASPMAFTTDGRFGYLANPASNSVERFSIDSAGNLASLGLTPAGLEAAYTLMDPTGRFLFVTSQNSGEMTVFRINQSDGTLKMAPGSPFTISQNGAPQLAATGLYVFVSESAGSGISTYRIDQNTGAPTLVATGQDPYVVLSADPSGHLLFAGTQVQENDGNQNTLGVLRIDQVTGALTFAGSVRLRGNTLPSAIHVVARIAPLRWLPYDAYIGLAGIIGTAGQVTAFGVDPTRGVLKSPPYNTAVLATSSGQQPSVIKRNDFGALIESTPDARGQGVVWEYQPPGDALITPFLALAAPDRNALASDFGAGRQPFWYARNCDQCGNDQWNVVYQTGRQGVQYSSDTLQGLSSLVADPLGQFLFATRLINGFAFNSVFALDPVTGAPSLVPNGAITWDYSLAAATDAGGRFVYSVDPNGSNVEVTYRVLNNGVLHAMSNSTFMGTKIVIDPSDKYAIGVNAVGALDPEAGPSSIYVYSIDPQFGLLTPVAGPYRVPNTARDMAMDDAGKFLYVANGGAVSIFAFNANDGSLSEVPFSPEQVGTPQAPVASAIAIATQAQ